MGWWAWLWGCASGESLATDEWVQPAGREADVLFVVDSDPAMSETHEALRDAAGILFEAFDEHDVDFRLASISTALTDRSEVPFITREDPDYRSRFTDAIGAGEFGPNQGLTAIERAVSSGFSRAEARLVVVVVSEHDDIDAFDVRASAFAIQNSRVHPTLATSTVITGDDATRFLQLTGFLRGVVGELGDVSAALEATAAGLAPQVRFVLTVPPDPDTLVVMLDETQIHRGWWYDASGPAIVFAEPPPLDAVLWVSYEPL